MNSDFKDLRAKALEALASKEAVDASQWGSNIKNLVEELSVHQIELEYQNEELIRAQAEVQRKSDEFADLFENAPVGHVIIDKDHSIINVNTTFCKMMMLEKIDVIGNIFENYISPIYKDSFTHFSKMLQKGVFAQIDLKLRSLRKGDVSVMVEGSGESGIFFYRLAISDITVQKRLEESLRREAEKLFDSELRFRQIVERSSDVFYYQNLITKRIEYISPTIVDLLGYTPDECMHMGITERLATMLPEYRESYLELVNSLLKAEVSGVYTIYRESEMLTKDNEKKWVKASYSLIKDDEDRPFKIIGTMHDITKDKEYEKAIITAKEIAENSNKLKSSFLANMSHEIRTPLNAIIGFSSVLKDELVDKGDDMDLEYVRIIEKNGFRLLELINDLISISQIESNHVEVRMSSFNLNNLLRDCYDAFRLEAAKKGLELVYTNSNVVGTITTDKEKLMSCLSNLIKNSIKYTKEGKVGFGAKLDKQGVLHCHVSDTGIGISEDKRSMIFERFSQINLTNSEEGVGLGLSIVKGLVSVLGGEISLQSEKGKGSIFSFSIPVAKK